MRCPTPEVHAIVERRIRPTLRLDAAEIEVVDVDEEGGVVRVRFTGAYAGSPCRETVLRWVVEPLFREGLPGLERVELEG